jgi:hypothetical protein
MNCFKGSIGVTVSNCSRTEGYFNHYSSKTKKRPSWEGRR